MSDNIRLENSHILVDGIFVNQKVHRVVQAIKEYEPRLDVEWIPQGRRQNENGDPLPAFKVIYNDPSSGPLILFFVKDEDEFDERVLARIIHNDQRNGSVTYSELEAWEAARKRLQHQEFLDALEEGNDIAWRVMRSPLNTYKVNDNLIIKDGIPHNVADEHRPKHL